MKKKNGLPDLAKRLFGMFDCKKPPASMSHNAMVVTTFHSARNTTVFLPREKYQKKKRE